jgi:hypothetical protein
MQVMGFFITWGGGDQKMGMSPFAGPGWTSKGVGLMGKTAADWKERSYRILEQQ